MAAGMGFARSLNEAGILNSTLLGVVGGNSGGSWFLAQLAYSETFYANVTGPTPMSTLVEDWMVRQLPLLEPGDTIPELLDLVNQWVAPEMFPTWNKFMRAAAVVAFVVSGASNAWLEVFCAVVSTSSQDRKECAFMLQLLPAGVLLSVQFEGAWSLAIERMMELSDPAIHTSTATIRDRAQGLNWPEIRFQISNATAYTVDGPATAWTVDNESRPAQFLATPVAWAVPGLAGGPDARAGFDVPPAVDRQGVFSGTYGTDLVSYRQEPLAPKFGGHEPGVSLIASMSSAFGGLLGSYNLTLSFLSSSTTAAAIQDLEDEDPADPIGAENVTLDSALEAVRAFAAEMATPAKETVVSDGCRIAGAECIAAKPQTVVQCFLRLAARCFSSISLPVADLAVCSSGDTAEDFEQRRCPFSNTRMIDGAFVDNTAATMTLRGLQQNYGTENKLRLVITTNEDCKSRGASGCDHGDLSLLFAHSAPPHPGAPEVTIFERRWSRVHLRPLRGTRYASYAMVSTVTVDNNAVGIVGGQRVDLLLLALDGPVSTAIGLSTRKADRVRLGAYAADATRLAVRRTMERWLRIT